MAIVVRDVADATDPIELLLRHGLLLPLTEVAGACAACTFRIRNADWGGIFIGVAVVADVRRTTSEAQSARRLKNRR